MRALSGSRSSFGVFAISLRRNEPHAMKAKLVFYIALGGLLATIALNNRQAVAFWFFGDRSVPLLLLMAIALVVGLGMGIAVARPRRAAPETEEDDDGLAEEDDEDEEDGLDE